MVTDSPPQTHPSPQPSKHQFVHATLLLKCFQYVRECFHSLLPKGKKHTASLPQNTIGCLPSSPALSPRPLHPSQLPFLPLSLSIIVTLSKHALTFVSSVCNRLENTSCTLSTLVTGDQRERVSRESKMGTHDHGETIPTSRHYGNPLNSHSRSLLTGSPSQPLSQPLPSLLPSVRSVLSPGCWVSCPHDQFCLNQGENSLSPIQAETSPSPA